MTSTTVELVNPESICVNRNSASVVVCHYSFCKSRLADSLPSPLPGSTTTTPATPHSTTERHTRETADIFAHTCGSMSSSADIASCKQKHSPVDGGQRGRWRSKVYACAHGCVSHGVRAGLTGDHQVSVRQRLRRLMAAHSTSAQVCNRTRARSARSAWRILNRRACVRAIEVLFEHSIYC